MSESVHYYLDIYKQDEKWSTGRKYFEMDVYYNSLIQEEKTENQVA